MNEPGKSEAEDATLRSGLICRELPGTEECRLLEETEGGEWRVHSFSLNRIALVAHYRLAPIAKRHNPMQTLVVMQGPPGSGKSTIAQSIARATQAVVCSTDKYHMEEQETKWGRREFYAYKPERAAEFHALNQAAAKLALERGENVVVDNTNITCGEAKPYVKMAVEAGVSVVFVRCDGKFPNVHGVPAEKVEWMRGRLEALTVEACLAAPDFKRN